MFQTVADKLGHGLFMIQNEKYLWVNESFTEIFEYEQEEIFSMHYTEFVYSEDLNDFLQLVSRFRAGEIEHYEIEIRGVTKSGSVIDISIGIKRVLYEDKPASIGSVMDISHRKRMEIELRESKNRYQNIVENAPVGIMVHQKGIIQYANAMACKLLGAKMANELIGQSINRFIHSQYAEVVKKRIHNIQNLGITASPLYQKIVRLDGSELDAESSGIPIQINDEVAVEMMFWDVTEKKKEEELIRYRAYYDTLTDLPNLQKFQLDFEEEFNGDQKFTILYLDLNGLKEINDFYGRQAGELVLIKVGARLSGALSNKGLVYRMDGYRFSIVFQGEVEDTELHAIIYEINHIVSQPIYTTNTTAHISLHIGVVNYPQDGGEFNLILHHADLAMNHAKITKSLYKKYDR